MQHENGVCWDDSQLHLRVRGYLVLPLIRVVHTVVCPFHNPKLSGLVAGWDDEENCPTLSDMVFVIMNGLSRTGITFD